MPFRNEKVQFGLELCAKVHSEIADSFILGFQLVVGTFGLPIRVAYLLVTCILEE